MQDQPALSKLIVQDQPVLAELLPLNSQSIVLNLNITTTKADLILNEISGWNPIPPSLLAPFIQQTSINKAFKKDRIFTIAFSTLYLTSLADFNTP
jgi:hypothetical protein